MDEGTSLPTAPLRLKTQSQSIFMGWVDHALSAFIKEPVARSTRTSFNSMRPPWLAAVQCRPFTNSPWAPSRVG